MGWQLNEWCKDMQKWAKQNGLNSLNLKREQQLANWCADRAMKYGNLPLPGMSNYKDGGKW